MYYFVSAGVKTTPLTLEVFQRKDVTAKVDDNGFSPKLIRIDEGNAVQWQWSGCAIQHSVKEAQYSLRQNALLPLTDERVIATKSGNLRRFFELVLVFLVILINVIHLLLLLCELLLLHYMY